MNPPNLPFWLLLPQWAWSRTIGGMQGSGVNRHVGGASVL